MVEASARNKSGWEDSNSDVSLFPVDGVEVAALGLSEIQIQLAPMNLWALEQFAKVLSVVRG